MPLSPTTRDRVYAGDSRFVPAVVEKIWAERLRKQTPTHERNAYMERSI